MSKTQSEENIPIKWDRKILVVHDQESANRLSDYLYSYQLDPYIPTIRLENKWIVPLLKGDVEQANPIFELPQPEKVGEFENVVKTADLPHGEVPEGEGWIIHAIYQKNTIWKQVKGV